MILISTKQAHMTFCRKSSMIRTQKHSHLDHHRLEHTLCIPTPVTCYSKIHKNLINFEGSLTYDKMKIAQPLKKINQKICTVISAFAMPITIDNMYIKPFILVDKKRNPTPQNIQRTPPQE